MRKPGFGEASQGALVGAVVAGIGGLFAVGVAPAIITRSMSYLFLPRIGLICWAISGPLGWLIGGQLGPRLGDALKSPRAEVVGGVLGGFIPVTLIALWGWYKVAG